MFDFAYPNSRPSERGWGSGYPNCQEEAWIPLVAPNGVGFGRVHRDIHELLVLVLGECIRRGYPPKKGQCWGAVCRCSHRSDGTCAEDAHGNPVPSNHSWGLAIDFNSIDNPYGADRQDSKLGGDPSLGWVPVLFKEYGFRWLGPPIDDWQHFDFAGNPSDAVAMTTKARNQIGDEMSTDDYIQGTNRAQEAAVKAKFADIGAPPDSWTTHRKAGWNDVRWQVNRLRVDPGTPVLPADVLRSGDTIVAVKNP